MTIRTACLVACVLAALATGASARIVKGTVTYAATGKRVVGAVVKAYDLDVGPSDFMGDSATDSEGRFLISYSSGDWDLCCLKNKRPDIQLQVFIEGTLWLKTGQLAEDVASDLSFNLLVQTPKISGTVRWAGSTAPVEDATIRAYDNDFGSRDLMGSTVTNSKGEFSVLWNPAKEWDIWAGNRGKPDIVVEVWWRGVLYATSNERSDTNADVSLAFQIPRYLVSGTVYWEETCKVASGVTVTVKDDDVGKSDTMASGLTSSIGTYAISVPTTAGGKNWDLGLSTVKYPDIYSEFSLAGKSKGTTSNRNDVSVPGGSSLAINQGITRLWKGDATKGAAAAATLVEGTVNWVEVEEFDGCTPRQIRVSFIINFQRKGGMSDAQWAKMKALTKQGLAENWSRTGSRAVLLPNGLRYDVVTQVVERGSGKDVELQWITKSDCKRSNNVGVILGFEWDPILYYREGCARARYGAKWESNEDYIFRETAGHEFGHSVLLATPPSNLKREKFGELFLTKGQVWSWSHKRTTNIRQQVLPSAPTYPATGDWDIMPYYNGDPLAGAYSRSFAVEDDVRKLVGLAGKKRVRGGACTCPNKK